MALVLEKLKTPEVENYGKMDSNNYQIKDSKCHKQSVIKAEKLIK